MGHLRVDEITGILPLFSHIGQNQTGRFREWFRQVHSGYPVVLARIVRARGAVQTMSIGNDRHTDKCNDYNHLRHIYTYGFPRRLRIEYHNTTAGNNTGQPMMPSTPKSRNIALAHRRVASPARKYNKQPRIIIGFLPTFRPYHYENLVSTPKVSDGNSDKIFVTYLGEALMNVFSVEYMLWLDRVQSGDNVCVTKIWHGHLKHLIRLKVTAVTNTTIACTIPGKPSTYIFRRANGCLAGAVMGLHLEPYTEELQTTGIEIKPDPPKIYGPKPASTYFGPPKPKEPKRKLTKGKQR
jgi:hypothetical protein